jgi:hypothetical protein
MIVVTAKSSVLDLALAIGRSADYSATFFNNLGFQGKQRRCNPLRVLADCMNRCRSLSSARQWFRIALQMSA